MQFALFAFERALLGASLVVLSSACGSRLPAQEPKEESSSSSEPESNPFRISGDGAKESSGSGGPGKSLVNEQGSRSLNTYDKQQIDRLMASKAALVKANCGAAKDESGKATGPWGKVAIRVGLGSNGHEKSVFVPPPYDGKPVGQCITRAYTNLSFSPWDGADGEVDVDVELDKPEGTTEEKPGKKPVAKPPAKSPATKK
jgi:hypothetical protein